MHTWFANESLYKASHHKLNISAFSLFNIARSLYNFERSSLLIEDSIGCGDEKADTGLGMSNFEEPPERNT